MILSASGMIGMIASAVSSFSNGDQALTRRLVLDQDRCRQPFPGIVDDRPLDLGEFHSLHEYIEPVVAVGLALSR